MRIMVYDDEGRKAPLAAERIRQVMKASGLPLLDSWEEPTVAELRYGVYVDPGTKFKEENPDLSSWPLQGPPLPVPDRAAE